MKAKKEKEPPTPQQRGRASSRKGKVHERSVAERVRGIYPDACRGIGQARRAGEVPDVDKTPWWWETKSYKKPPAAHRVMKQAREALADNRKKNPHAFPAGPLLVIKQTGGEELAVLPFEKLLELLAELHRLREAVDRLL